MEKNERTSFVLHFDSLDILNELTDEQAGKLFRLIANYHKTRNSDIAINDPFIRAVFLPFRLQADRDIVKYNSKCEERSYSGRLGNLKRYNVDLYDLVVSNSINIEDAERVANSRKTSLSDRELANVAYKKKKSKKKSKKENINIEDFDFFWNTYDKKEDRAKCLIAWGKLNNTDIEKIKSVVAQYVKSKPDRQYRKNPLTWLNGKCWNDEITQTSINSYPTAKYDYSDPNTLPVRPK